MLHQPEGITASHRGMLPRIACQDDSCRIPCDLQQFPHVSGSNRPRLINPNHLSSRFCLKLGIGKEMRERLCVRKSGIAQVYTRSRRRRRKGEYLPSSGLNLRHYFAHGRRFADPCQAANPHHLIAAVENVFHCRPLLRRKLFIGEPDIPSLERCKHSPTAPHRVDECDFLRKHFDRRA